MKNQILNVSKNSKTSWLLFGFALIAAALLMPEIAFAQDTGFNFGPDSGIQGETEGSFREYWNLFANSALYIGLFVVLAAFIVPMINSQVAWIGVIIWIIAFAGDNFVTGLRDKTGFGEIENTTTQS